MFRLCCITLAILNLVTPCVSLIADVPVQKSTYLYVATYSPQAGEGVFVTTFDLTNGTLGVLRPTGGQKSPAALAIHPGGKFVYATTLIQETPEKSSGGIAALAIDPKTGELREIDRRMSGGTGPCHLSIDNHEQCLLVAHCGTSSVACWQLQPDGRFGKASTNLAHVGESRNAEGKSQAHSILAAPGNRFAIAADLGLDRLFVYRLEAQAARLTPHDPPFTEVTHGAGPRHLATHPNGRFVYSVNELGNTVTAYAFSGETGRLKRLSDVSTLPADFHGESYAAEIQIHPTGRFLYASNRGHDSLAMFSIDEKSGQLDLIGHVSSQGKFPRHFAQDPAGRFLIVANQKSNQLSMFSIDPVSGQLTAQGTPVPVPQPVCVKFVVQNHDSSERIGTTKQKEK